MSYTGCNGNWHRLFLCIAMILLVFVVLSAPIISKIYFIKVFTGKTTHSFGVYGECLMSNPPACSPKLWGYNLSGFIISSLSVDGSSTENKTQFGGSFFQTKIIGITIPAASGLALTALILSFMPTRYRYWMSLAANLLAFGGATAGLVLESMLFPQAKKLAEGKFHIGDFGVAHWLLVTAVLCLFFGVVFVIVEITIDSHERRRRERGGDYFPITAAYYNKA